jgi:hypothetical protein
MAHHRTPFRRALAALSLIAALSLAAGCGADGPDLVEAGGTVTMDGKPLPDAYVHFTPEAGRASAGRTDADGKYALSYSQTRMGVIPGRHVVKITTYQAPYTNDEDESVPETPESVPVQFNIRSTLTADVVGDGSPINFDLTSEGEIFQPGAPDLEGDE